MNTPQRELDLTQALAAERAALKTLFALPAGYLAVSAVAEKSPVASQSDRTDATARSR